MPVRCENCDHIHWDEVPQARKTYRFLRKVYRVKPNITFTRRNLAKAKNISEQIAARRLETLCDLGVIRCVTSTKHGDDTRRHYKFID